MELLKVDTLEEMMEKLGRYVNKLPLNTEEIPQFMSLGKTLAEDVYAEENIPGFNRSAVDGYAVRSVDTGGASESIPAFLRVIGEVEMGKAPARSCGVVGSGQCVYVPTGGMVPKGADAVIMVEYCEEFADNQIAVYSSAAHGSNMVMAGEDVLKGQHILKKGQRLTPAGIGLLSSVGRTSVKVYRPWKISILSTGDEIIEPSLVPADGQVRDVNTFALIAQAEEMGMNVVHWEVVCDNEERLREKVAEAMNDSDLVFISGGSSQGKKDATARIIGALASNGVITHGVAVKPGKPTITGFDEASETMLIGLPGHPVAAVMLFRLITAGLWNMAVMGRSECKNDFERLASKGISYGHISMNIAASAGRKTFQLVKLIHNNETLPTVVPVLGKSGLIRTMADADGFIVMDVNDEGINKGELVKVYLI